MDPLRRAQIILLCDLCKTAHLQSHCERCDISLCEVCVGKHLSDTSVRHKVVPYKYRKSLNYSQCPDHADEHCKHYSEKCEIPVCSTCVSSGKHNDHDISDILDKIDSKRRTIQKDLEELETKIFPQYEEFTSDVQTQKAGLETNYENLITAADQQGEILHREITAIVNQRKSDIQETKNKHLSTLDKNTEEITQKITELKQIIADLKSILKSNDVSLTSTYKSRNSEFRSLPPEVRVILPSFSPGKINKDQLNEMFGSLSSLSINTEHGETMKSPEAVSSPPVKPMKSAEAVSSPVKPMKSLEAVSSPSIPLLHEPRLIATIDTGYKHLCSVSCLSDEVWTCGNENILKLINLQGILLTSMQTESGNEPQDIAVTRGGDLVYIDSKTINLVKNKQVRTLITLQGWTPRYVCCTASDDILVIMISDDREQSKVVRYSDSKETQTIQYDDQGRHLYSSGYFSDIKYISENKNLDICVADSTASTVVVVNQYGKLQFRYTGHPLNTDKSFTPVGITTDSQSHILTADCSLNERIHILDQNGQFLRYIQNCYLDVPCGLCVDSRDNLFVAEYDSAKVKKIQYL